MATARVLLADDHAIVRSGIANAITELPNVAVIAEVGDGPTLFRALAHHQPDCLLIDITMPHFEPISDIGRVRSLYPTLKILVVSAYDDDVYVQGLLGIGVNGYHLKDQPLNDLRLAVQRVLSGERWICSSLVDKLVRFHESEATQLTERQRQLLACLQEGLDNNGIARHTGLSVKTIENHLTRLYRQLGVQSRLEAVTYIRQHPGLLGSHKTAVERDASKPDPARLVLMVVDDNARYRTQLQRMISRAYPNALIHEADNTQTALEIVQTSTPRLAFIDVVLGDENGIDCARQMHGLVPQTRLILFSAYPDREFHHRGLQAGAVAFLDKKDVDAAALRELIEDVL